MRVQAIISYDGSKYFGMQSQPHKQTIQDEIEKSLKKLNINTKINYAGRTDTKVHALNQSIDFSIPTYWQNTKQLQKALNKALPNSILIKKINIVNNDFHSRFWAKKRSYRYVITQTNNPFLSDYSLYKPFLNINAIKKSIKLFEGEHDFEYFSKKGSEVKNYKRIIYQTNIIRHKNYIIIKFVGNGFLRSQIRMMVQFLLDIAEDKLSQQQLQQQLNKTKKISSTLAKPNGLYFERVWY